LHNYQSTYLGNNVIIPVLTITYKGLNTLSILLGISSGKQVDGGRGPIFHVDFWGILIHGVVPVVFRCPLSTTGNPPISYK
jgi:hypothetical protein